MQCPENVPDRQRRPATPSQPDEVDCRDRRRARRRRLGRRAARPPDGRARQRLARAAPAAAGRQRMPIGWITVS
jgi:hypothetical protein